MSLPPSSSEPHDVGPFVGGHLRASDADRDQVMRVLSTAFAEGRITADEHEERMQTVLAAKTFAELVPVTRDLVPAASSEVRPAPPQQVASTDQRGWDIQPSGSTESDQMVAIFGGVTRKGKWRMKRYTQSFALFGGVDLDLNEATYEAPVVEISGAWIFGGLDIKVPAGIEVRDQVMGIFGGSDISRVGDPQPGAPVLVIKGFTLFGGVTVSGPKPKKVRRRR